MSKKWYAEGLKFSCTCCGDCCRGPGGYVWITEEDAHNMADTLGMEFQAFTKKYTRLVDGRLALVDSPKGDCVFVRDDNLCGVHKGKPEICRNFPWWNELLKDEDSWNHNRFNCPGQNQGKVHTLKDIERQMKNGTD